MKKVLPERAQFVEQPVAAGEVVLL